MPLYQCKSSGCDRPGLRGPSGVCMACSNRFCVAHILPCGSHPCPSYDSDPKAVDALASTSLDEELRDLAERLNPHALTQLASTLRNGRSCRMPDLTCDCLRSLPRGGMNFHPTITFDDGVEWICRVRRRNASTLPLGVQDAVLMSEVATLNFLSSRTKVPAPRVYHFAPPSSTTNPVGVGYILMEKMRGKEMNWHRLSQSEKTKVLDQLADIFNSLRNHPFSEIGCLNMGTTGFAVDETQNLSVGALVGEDSVRMSTDGAPTFLGPFSTLSDYLHGLISLHLEQVLAKECHIDPVDHYLTLNESLKLIPSICHLFQNEASRFYLKHMDDKGDHILIDEDHNITGILDWEWAQTLPEEFAFASPLFLVDVGAYYDGEDKLSEDEELFAEILDKKGYGEIAKCVRGGRVTQRLAHLVDYGLDAQDLPTHLRSLRRLVDGDELEWDSWKAEQVLDIPTSMQQH